MEFADAGQPGGQTTFCLDERFFSPNWVYRTETGQTSGVVRDRLDDVVVGFDCDVRVGPSHAHDHGAVNAVTVHGR
ncbi:uncharacterized protein METZ01_LOCUS34131 [marine metagenome]|uniref:Uncharacterized protein n=1 Tax=marine metagenome TaxID=408172 RepID=A0A381QTZ9_9ZZZZ